MPDWNFELTIICSQRTSRSVVDQVREFGVEFEVGEERGFAPPSQDVAIQVLLNISTWLPLIVNLVKALWKKKAYIDFETRHRLARRMLADLGPLYWTRGEDTPEYSYYEFKTARCNHFWEMDHGEIRHGPVGRS